MEIINTRRLRLFLTRMKPADHYETRDMWIAFRTDVDRPMVCATAVITDPIEVFRGARYVDWLEVASEYRRIGFATEMLGALRKFYKQPLDMSAGSDSGEAFLNAIEERWKLNLI